MKRMLKKLTAGVLSAAMLFSLAACGGKGEPEAEKSGETENVEVDEGLLNVEITLPADMFEETPDPDEAQAEAVENGMKECIVNEDGSVTYAMSKSRHKELMAEMAASIEKSMLDLTEGEEPVESFKKVEHNEDFSVFDITVDPVTFSPFDAFASMGLYLAGAYYQLFDGAAEEDMDVVINYIDMDTGEVLDSSSLREMKESMEEDEPADEVTEEVVTD